MGQQEQVATFLKQQQLPCTLWAAMYRGRVQYGETRLFMQVRGQTWVGLWPKACLQVRCPPSAKPSHRLNNCCAKAGHQRSYQPADGLYRCKNGELLSRPHYHQALRELSQEIAELYRLFGWTLDKPLLELTEQVARNTAANTSSTLQDILAKRPTELPYICGYLLAQAQALHQPLPITSRLYHRLNPV